MRIAYVCLEDLTKGGGGKVHFWSLARAMHGLGHEVLIVAPQYSSKTITYPIGLNGIACRIPWKNSIGVLLFEMFLLAYIPFLKKKRGIESILVRGGPAILMGTVFRWARFCGTRVVLECNGVPWEEYKAHGAGKAFCSFIEWGARDQAGAASALIGVTPSIVEAFGKDGKCGDAFAISNGAAVEEFNIGRRNDLRQRFKINDEEIVLVLPSSFTPWHGILEVIDSLTCLPECLRGRVRLILIGEGSLFSLAKEHAAAQGLMERILFTGALPHDKVIEWVIASDIGLFLCSDPGKLRYPGSPLKLFEYFASGLAVIVPDDPYHSKMNSYYRIGETVPKTDAEHISNAIALLAYREAFRETGARNRTLCEKEFTWTKVAERVLDILQGRLPQLEEWQRTLSVPSHAFVKHEFEIAGQ